MSNPEVGEAYVKIRPVVGDDFPQQVGTQVNEALKTAQAQADKVVDETTKKIADLQLRAEAAALRQDPVGASRLGAQANLEQVLFAAQQSRAQAASLVGQDQAAMRELLLASADAYDQASVKLQELIARSQRTGKEVAAPGVLSKIEELAGGGTRGGSRGGIAGILGSVGRLGLAGGVAFAGFQAIGQISQMLKATGDEAYTAQGKLRNFGAEILTGNIIGGIRALAAEKPATIVGSLAQSLADLKAKSDPLVVTQEKLTAKFEESPEALKEYLGILVAFGKISIDTAVQMEKITRDLEAQTIGARASADAWADLARRIQEAGSEAAVLGERGGDFGRGAGGVDAQKAARAAGLDPTVFQAGTGGQAVADQVREDRAGRIRDEGDRLAAQLAAAKITQKHARELFENLKDGAGGAAAAYAALSAATTKVIGYQNQIKDNAEAAAATAAAAADAKKKEAAAAAEAVAADKKAGYEQTLENNLAKAALTKRKTDDLAAFATAIDYWKSLAHNATSAGDRADAAAHVIDLRSRRQKFLAGEADTGAEHTAAEFKELQIQNRIAAAGLTPGIADDKRFAKQLVDFWKEQVKNATGFEKEQDKSRLIAARLALQALSKKTQEGDSPDVFIAKLYESAADQFRRFGSNFTATRGGLLAPQDARGELAGILGGGQANAWQTISRTTTAQLSESKRQTALLQIIAGGPVRRITGVPVPKSAQDLGQKIADNVARGL